MKKVKSTNYSQVLPLKKQPTCTITTSKSERKDIKNPAYSLLAEDMFLKDETLIRVTEKTLPDVTTVSECGNGVIAAGPYLEFEINKVKKVKNEKLMADKIFQDRAYEVVVEENQRLVKKLVDNVFDKIQFEDLKEENKGLKDVIDSREGTIRMYKCQLEMGEILINKLSMELTNTKKELNIIKSNWFVKLFL